MKLPKKIKFGHRTITVEYTDKLWYDQRMTADVCVDSHHIEIDSTMGDGVQRRSLFLNILYIAFGTNFLCENEMDNLETIVLGFFADNVRRRIMAPSYYSSMGESAYLSLAGLTKDHQTFAPLYGELADKFDHFVDVLACVAPWNRPDSDAELLRIYERWLVTGDANLKELLERKGISTDDAPPTLKQQ